MHLCLSSWLFSPVTTATAAGVLITQARVLFTFHDIGGGWGAGGDGFFGLNQDFSGYLRILWLGWEWRALFTLASEVAWGTGGGGGGMARWGFGGGGWAWGGWAAAGGPTDWGRVVIMGADGTGSGWGDLDRQFPVPFSLWRSQT